VLEFADKLGVDHLVLFHHDPYHTDEELEAMLAAALARHPSREKVCLAYEGMRFTLSASGVEQTADTTA
jgi:hypothetical protein